MFMRGRRKSQKQFWTTTRTKAELTLQMKCSGPILLKLYLGPRRWPLAAFFNLLDIVSLNTYVICKDITLFAQNRRQFLIKLGEQLCASERRRRNEMPHLLRLKRVCDGVDEDLPPNKKTKCRICNSNKTRTKCENYSRNVCGTCSTPMCKKGINLE